MENLTRYCPKDSLQCQGHPPPKESFGQRKYEIPVRQVVIYLGSEKPRMRTLLSKEEQITGFELKDIKNVPLQSTLDSEVPEEIILSILTDYEKSEAGKVIDKIIYKLQEVSKSESELNKSIKQLMILSRLRKLEVKIKQKVNDMPITYDISKGFRGKKPTDCIMKEFEKEFWKESKKEFKKAEKKGFRRESKKAEKKAWKKEKKK